MNAPNIAAKEEWKTGNVQQSHLGDRILNQDSSI